MIYRCDKVCKDFPVCKCSGLDPKPYELSIDRAVDRAVDKANENMDDAFIQALESNGTVHDNDATRNLPIPHGKGREIFPLVLSDLSSNYLEGIKEDLLLRRQYGIDTYGEPLTAFNGREIEVDTLQDGLDYIVYLRQCMEEGLKVDKCYWLAIESIVLFYKITGR